LNLRTTSGTNRLAITIDSFKVVPYLKTEHLGDGRIVKLMPMWDGKNFRMWIDTSVGLVEANVMETIEGDYVGVGAARDSDLFIPFVHLMWQRASWPEICPLITSISDDFHNMGTSLAKLKHFFRTQQYLPPGSASRFVYTELEYLIMLSRGVFDLLQEMISLMWTNHVQLHDEKAEARHRSRKLPKTFSKLVLRDKQQPRSATEIENEFLLPKPLSEQYANLTPFFSQLRDLRDAVIHGGTGVGQIYVTERGFCINPKQKPFSSFNSWRPEHYYNDNIASVLPWIGDLILRTIQACNSLITTFGQIIQLSPEIAPGYIVYVRGPHNESVAEVLNVHSGGSPWWQMNAESDSTVETAVRLEQQPPKYE
jgi:hypothetical protein